MTIELNEKDTNLLLKALGELPAKESIDMILRLQVTWNEQEKNSLSKADKSQSI